jgi:hemerythrin superfamily protein
MDAIQLLKQDHRTVESLFKEFERAGQKAHHTKRRLVKRMIQELSLHADLEEQVFYPALQGPAKGNELVLKALEEHALLKSLLQQLEKMSPEEERFQPKVTVLIQNVRQHFKEEEGKMFPQLKQALKPAQLRELGHRLEEGRKAIQSPKDYLRMG